jgi:hypothetical protein
MATAVEITRVGAQVDPTSKGWGPSGNPEEWKVVVLLSDTPNRMWHRAWETTWPEVLRGSELDAAEWEYKPNDQRIEIWTTEELADKLIRQLDGALDETNTRCREMVDNANESRIAQAGRADEERAEATRLQEKLDSI